MTKAPFFCLVAVVAGVALSSCSPPVVRDSASSRGSPSPGLPMGGRVLFSAGGEDLWSSLPDGGDRERITTDGKTTGDHYVGGRWSPDGRAIAAERSMAHESGNALYLIELAGHSALRLTQPDTFLDGYSWSPDGRLLAYAEVTSGGTLAAGGTLSGGVGAVHVYDRAARTDRIVAPGNHPAFSPDGRLIGFAHAAGAVAVVPPEGGATTFLANLPELSRYSILAAPKGMALLSGPAWSSDGRYVAYSAIERGPILEALQVIYVQEALPNAPPHQWAIGKTGAAHHVADLRWSPTAPVLAYAFIYAQPHHHYLGTIDPSRAELQPLFDSANHFLDYSWSPDGSTILLQIDDRDEWVYIAAGNGAIVRRSTPGGWRPDWCRCPTN